MRTTIAALTSESSRAMPFVALVWALGACGPDSSVPPTPPAELVINPVATYGIVEGTVDPGDRIRLSGDTLAVLSNIADAAEATNGNLFVLDRDVRRVVVFAPDGQVLRTIGGGFGEGPGEFSRPTALALEGERLFILDLSLRRVSWFDTTGVFLESIQAELPGEARSLAVTNDTIWILTRITEVNSTDVVHGYSLAGQPLFRRGDPSRRSVDFARHGSTGTLAQLRDGGILFVSGVPLQWSDARADDWASTQVGSYLWPGKEPYESRESDGVLLRRTPGGTRGMTELQDGDLAVLYYEVFDDEATGSATYSVHLALVSPSGEWKGRYAFPDSIGQLSFVRAGAEGASLLVGSHNPFPRVLRLVVEGTR